jgi:hypothetical protein
MKQIVLHQIHTTQLNQTLKEKSILNSKQALKFNTDLDKRATALAMPNGEQKSLIRLTPLGMHKTDPPLF